MISGSLSHELLVCLGRLESHLTNCLQFMVGEALSLADVVTWAALYVLLSPEGSTPPGEVNTRHAKHVLDSNSIKEPGPTSHLPLSVCSTSYIPLSLFPFPPPPFPLPLSSPPFPLPLSPLPSLPPSSLSSPFLSASPTQGLSTGVSLVHQSSKTGLIQPCCLTQCQLSSLQGLCPRENPNTLCKVWSKNKVQRLQQYCKL